MSLRYALICLSLAFLEKRPFLYYFQHSNPAAPGSVQSSSVFYLALQIIFVSIDAPTH